MRRRLSDGTSVEAGEMIGVLDELLLAASHARWLLKHASEFVLSSPSRPERGVRLLRRGADAWAVWLGEFALHPDGCFWNAVPGTDPTYPRDEAVARAIQALERLP